MIFWRGFDRCFNISIAFSPILHNLQLLLRGQVSGVEVSKSKIDDNLQIFIDFGAVRFSDTVLNKFDVHVRLLFLNRNLNDHSRMHHVIPCLVSQAWLDARICKANFNIECLLDHIAFGNLKAERPNTMLNSNSS